jgi:hypothetical protein
MYTIVHLILQEESEDQEQVRGLGGVYVWMYIKLFHFLYRVRCAHHLCLAAVPTL